MRREPYADAYDRSTAHRADRVHHRPRTIRAYLLWARRQYELETPSLDHSQSLVADDGDPEMKAAAQSYLGLAGAPTERADDWRSIAGRKDADGAYITPLRYAIECIRAHDPQRAEFLALLVSDALPVANHYLDVPPWCVRDVMYRSLEMLWDRFSAMPIPRRAVGWVDKSDAQRAAEEAA